MGLKRLSDDEFAVLVGIHCRLSPENLSADGELPRREVERRRQALMTELGSAMARFGLTEEECDECAVLQEDTRRRRAARELRQAGS